MSKGVLSVARAIEKSQPIYVAMRKVMNWYQQHPITPAHIASRISDLHERVDSEHLAMEERHAKEFLPIMQKVRDAQEEAKALGLKHRREKEDVTLAFAVVEMDLLTGKIKQVPEHLKPLDSRPSKTLSIGLRFAAWLRKKFPERKVPKQMTEEVVNSPEKAPGVV